MTTPFAKRLAATATEQYSRYGLLREQQSPLCEQIRAYWDGIAKFPGVSTAWSAVFISWCVRHAGATSAEFEFAQAHSRFVHTAIQNELTGIGVFRGHPVNDYAPKVGDILHNNRSGHTFTYDFARTNSKYESHSAIVVEVGIDPQGRYLRTIGGNESDSVGLKEVRLHPTGKVRNKDGLYISVIENLK